MIVSKRLEEPNRARRFASLGLVLVLVLASTGVACSTELTGDGKRFSVSPPLPGDPRGATTPRVVGVDGPTSTGPLPLTQIGPNLSPVKAVWARESLHPIEWKIPTTLGELDPAVTVEVSSDYGATWDLLDEVVSAELYFQWQVPAIGPDHARVRVTFHRTKLSTDPEIPDDVYPVLRLESGEVTFTPSQKKSYTWQRVADDAPFGPRDGAGGITFNGKMWLIGGWNGNRFPMVTANDVWSSPDGATWTMEKPNTFLDAETFNYESDWEGRHFAGYHVFGGQMWIVAGDPNQGHYQSDVWSSPDGRQWTRRDIHTSTPRRYLVTNPASAYFGQILTDEGARPVEEAQFGNRAIATTGVFGGKLFLMGGQRIEQYVDPSWPGAPSKTFNDVWSSSDGASWAPVQTTGPMWSPRGLISEVVEHDGRMWLIGGGLLDDVNAGRTKRELNNDVWSTSDGARWEKSADKPPFSPRLWHNVKSFDGRLWVINGYDGYEAGQGRTGDNRGDVWYSADGKNWYDGSPPPSFVPRHAGTSWVHAGSIFVGSGNAFAEDPLQPDVAKWFADVWKMTPVP